MPMFPELKPLFRDAFEQAKDGAVYCLDKYRGQWSNLGTNMKRIVKKAGLVPWPKLFQNCRSTRETELMKEFPIHEVCEYIGNSPVVAMAHYAQVTDDDRKKAAQYRTPTKADEKVGLDLGLNSGEVERRPVQGHDEGIDVTPDDCTTKDQFALACTDPQSTTEWAVQDLNL